MRLRRLPVIASAATVLVPLVTPTNSMGEVSRPCLGALMSTLAGRVDGYITGLSTGEGWKLTDRQWTTLTETVAEFSGDAPVYAGILRPTTDAVRRLARVAPRLGVRGVVVTQPFATEVDTKAAVRHFRSIYETCGLPLILYHETTFARTVLDGPALAAIIEHCEVAAIKDSAPNSGANTLWSQLPPIRRLQGYEALLDTDPADGAIVGLANIEADLVRQVYDSKSTAAERIAASVDRYQLLTPTWYMHLKKELNRRRVIASPASLTTPPSPEIHVSTHAKTGEL